MAKTITCPECGKLFDPRGIKPHRAVQHGVSIHGRSEPPSLQRRGDAATPEVGTVIAGQAPAPAPAAAPPVSPPPQPKKPWWAIEI